MRFTKDQTVLIEDYDGDLQRGRVLSVGLLKITAVVDSPYNMIRHGRVRRVWRGSGRIHPVTAAWDR